MYKVKRLGLNGLAGDIYLYDASKGGFYNPATGRMASDILQVGGRDNTGYSKSTGVYFDLLTGENFGKTPPAGVSPISWYQEGSQVVVPVGQGTASATQAQADALKSQVSASLAQQAQQASSVTNTQQQTSQVTSTVASGGMFGMSWTTLALVGGAAYFLFFRGKR